MNQISNIYADIHPLPPPSDNGISAFETNDESYGFDIFDATEESLKTIIRDVAERLNENPENVRLLIKLKDDNIYYDERVYIPEDS